MKKDSDMESEFLLLFIHSFIYQSINRSIDNDDNKKNEHKRFLFC